MNQKAESHNHSWRSVAKEFIDLSSMVLRWGAVLGGGLSLLVYTKEIRRFPAGIGLGEGLAFYLISAALVLYYVVYLVCVSSIGSVLMRFPFELLLKFDHRKRLRNGDPSGVPPNTTLAAMTGLEVVVMAAIGGIFYLLLVMKTGAPWYAAVGAPAVQGATIALWLIINRRQEFDKAGLVLPVKDATKERNRLRQQPFARRVVLFMLIFMPLFFMPSGADAVRIAFSTAQLRKEGAVLHVQKRWSGLLTMEKGLASPLGPEYRKFACADVLLYGIGEVVVIDRNSLAPVREEGKCHGNANVPDRDPVALPAERVWVE